MEPSATLFVADVPPNTVGEQFENAFRAFEGFVTSRLRFDRNEKLVGFVEFTEPQFSTRAMEVLARAPNPFDNSGTPLNIQYSRSSGSNRRRDFGDDRRVRSAVNSGLLRTPGYGPAQMMPLLGMGGDLTGYAQSQSLPSYNTPLTAMYGGLAPDASSTLYVEGLPTDATEREIAHIFRPYAGFQSVRVFPKTSGNQSKPSRLLCFAEFESKMQATVAMSVLQGYRMDKLDVHGLRIAFAKTQRKSPGERVPNGTAAVAAHAQYAM